MAEQMIVCGIDPGKDGGICLLSDSGEVTAVVRMPTMQVGKKREYNLPAIVNIINQSNIVVIEKVHAMPGQGVTSMFSFGQGYGYMIGIASGLMKPYYLIIPQTWKRHMLEGMSKDKGAAIMKVHQLYPRINLFPTLRSRKPHDGMAESILIAKYYKDFIRRSDE